MPNTIPTDPYILTAGGGTINLPTTDTLSASYSFSGTATLAGSYTIQSSGTAYADQYYSLLWTAAITLSGNSVTIFGRAMTQQEALNKMYVLCRYNGLTAAWDVYFIPTVDVTGRFYHGVTTTTVPAGGGTVSLNPALSKGFQVYNSGAGTITLTSDYTITATGTPIEGDEFFILWSGTVYPDGNTVTIFGETLTDSQVTNGDVLVHVVYSSSAWVVLQGATNPASTVVSKSYSQLQTMVSASTLEINRTYFVNDRNIWITAIEDNRFALQGSFKMLAPDYQDVSGLFGGVWISTMAVPAIGDLYSYNNFMWSSVTGAVGTAPSGDAVNWLCKGTYGSGTWKDWVNKTGSEYQTEIYACEYDFTNDWVQLIHDKRRGNKIGASYQSEQVVALGYNVIDKFQWGNNSSIGNVAFEALISNANSLGTVSANLLGQGAQIVSNVLTATSSIQGNTLGAYAQISSCTLGAGADIQRNQLLADIDLSNKTLSANIEIESCQIGVSWTGTETIATDIVGKTLLPGYSNMAITLDLDTAIYAGTTLTIPTYYDYVGRFTLTSGLAKTITVIVNLPTNHISRFEGVNGITYTFTSAAIGAAAAGNPVRTAGAGNDLVVGRTDGADFIEFEKAGTLCRQYNAAILT